MSVAIDLTPDAIDQASRYRTTPVYQRTDTGETWVTTRQPMTIGVDDSDRYEKPRPGERWDQFAARMWPELGDLAPRYAWLLRDLNGIVNPFTALDPDKDLRVPTSARLLLQIGTTG